MEAKLAHALTLFLALAAPAATLAAAPESAIVLPRAESLGAESLVSIAAWLRHSGKEGFLAADVADAAGIPRGEAEEALGVSQRGFRSGEVLRVAQISTDAKREFLLFMAQHPDGSVFFFVSTPREGLKRAFISLPNLGTVLPLQGEEARETFAREISYWEARSAGL